MWLGVPARDYSRINTQQYRSRVDHEFMQLLDLSSLQLANMKTWQVAKPLCEVDQIRQTETKQPRTGLPCLKGTRLPALAA